jgi:hypothetical protein
VFGNRFHKDRDNKVYNATQKPWQIAKMFARYHTSGLISNKALVLGAGSGSEVVGCLAAGVSVIAIENNKRQLEGLRSRIDQALAHDSMAEVYCVKQWSMGRPSCLLTQEDEHDYVNVDMLHFDPDMRVHSDRKKLWDERDPEVRLNMGIIHYFESEGPRCGPCSKVLEDDESLTCRMCGAHMCTVCGSDGFCSIDCKSKGERVPPSQGEGSQADRGEDIAD